MKDLIVSFTGKVKRKHRAQFDIINKLGMTIDSFVNYEYELGKEFVENGNRIYQSKSGLLSRGVHITRYLISNKRRIHHVQLFSSGRFNIIYIILSRIYKLPILLVERGGLNQYIKKGAQDKLTYISTWLLYKSANYTWYKEHYMLNYLKDYGCRNVHFIPNCIDTSSTEDVGLSYEKRDTDYLWVNGVIPMRHVDWVVKVARLPQFKNKTFKIYGFLEDQYSQNKLKELKTILPENIELYSYQSNVLVLMQRAKFFLLPADYVFGNFSLLESMARGAVPIVSDVEGTNKVICDGVNGLSHDNNYDSFRHKMLKTLDIKQNNWISMSKNATRTIQENFSLESFQKKLTQLYKKINPLPNEN